MDCFRLRSLSYRRTSRRGVYHRAGHRPDPLAPFSNDGSCFTLPGSRKNIEMTLKLFELVGADETRPFSPFCSADAHGARA